MADWLWYATLGAHVGALAAWVGVTWWSLRRHAAHERALIERWWATEQDQMARWQAAWRTLAEGAGATFHAAPPCARREEEDHGG